MTDDAMLGQDKTQETSATPQQEQPTPASQATTSTPAPKTNKPKKWLLPVVAGAAVLLLGGGAYGYFGVYTQSPSYIWKQSVKKTGEGLKAFLEQVPATPKSSKINGTFKLTTPVAADGTLTSVSDEKNMQLTTSFGAAGIRANLELRGITPSGASNPDLYVKVDGVKGLAGLAGSSASEIEPILNSVDGKWFVVDHTLLDQATASLKTSDAKIPSNEELRKDMIELSKSMTAVLNERVFTTDDTKAVAALKAKVAKEDFKGRASQHITVQIRKQQLKDFVVAMKDTIKDSKVRELFAPNTNGKTFEQAIDFDGMLKDLDKANYDTMVADVWLDSSLHYIRNVRIPIVDEKDAKKTTGSIDFMLDYKGGDEYPLSVTMSNKDKDAEGTITIGMTLKKASSDATLTLGLDMTSEGQKIQGSAEFKMSGSNDAVSVEKPAGATNIMNLLGSYMSELQQLSSGLGALTGDSLPTSTNTASCLAEYQAYAASGGQSALSAACQTLDDTQL